MVFVRSAPAESVAVSLLSVKRRSKANNAEALRIAETKIPEVLEKLKPFAAKNPTVIIKAA